MDHLYTCWIWHGPLYTCWIGPNVTNNPQSSREFASRLPDSISTWHCSLKTTSAVAENGHIAAMTCMTCGQWVAETEASVGHLSSKLGDWKSIGFNGKTSVIKMNSCTNLWRFSQNLCRKNSLPSSLIHLFQLCILRAILLTSLQVTWDQCWPTVVKQGVGDTGCCPDLMAKLDKAIKQLMSFSEITLLPSTLELDSAWFHMVKGCDILSTAGCLLLNCSWPKAGTACR